MDVIIIGAGGHGKVVLDILREAGEHRPIGFLDADASLVGTQIGGLPVLGPVNQVHKLKQQHKAAGAIIAIGDNRVRASYASLVQEQGLELINAIHPRATVSRSATIGRNVVICAHAVVCAEAKVGDSCIINTGAIVDHECEIEPAAHICPGVALAGRVRVGKQAFVGTGARVIPCLRIGDNATIGAGAVVIRDVPARITVVGVPARTADRA
jgi:sugar O-acyltransferase (sialic acid O-acetyltransferase NeuD family)